MSRFSSLALARSRPNGFSTTSRAQPPFSPSFIPASPSLSTMGETSEGDDAR
jgi:hypothetical protein